MEEKRYKVLSIGAHPDDADTSASGLLYKLVDRGWEARLLSVTDGSAGTYDVNRCGAPLAAIRREESRNSGALIGATYDVWDLPDARLEATLENRERMIRYIREFQPDLILTNRPGDYHPDHRNTALLVADASYLLTVPSICSDVPAMKHMPVILYWADDFQRPYPMQADVIVPIDGYQEGRVEMACCHRCQYFDWMYWPDRMERKEWPWEKQVDALRQRFFEGDRRARLQVEEEVVKKWGPEKAEKIQAVELYEICEFGESLGEDLRKILEE